MKDINVARQLFTYLFYSYLVAFAISLICLFGRGGDLLSAVPAVILSEPWYTLVGHFLKDYMEDNSWTNQGIDDDYLDLFQIALLILCGSINVLILSGTRVLLKRAEVTVNV